MKLFFILIISLVLTAIVQADQYNYSFSSSLDAERFHALTQEIRCVVCQNQNIADSNAPLAQDLRDKIYRMVQTQQSDEVIKDYLVKRYGEFILLKPRFNSHTYLLWGFPGLAMLFIVLFILLSSRKKIVNC